MTQQTGGAREPKRRVFSPRAALVLAGVLIVAALGIAIALDVGGVRDRLFGGGTPPIHRMAILTVENLSKDPAQAYLAQGLTNLLILDMNRIIPVIAASSVAKYKQAPKPIPDIGRELNVDAILQCGVLRSGDRVRLTATLTHAPTNRRLWEQTYDRDLRDLRKLRDEVTLAVARQAGVRLTGQQETLLASRGPVNPAAQDALMRGMWGGNPAKTEESIKQAIQLDPTYAEAYDFLAQTYSMRAMYPTRVAPKVIYPKVEETARKAISLDPSLPLSHRALATVALEYDWNFAEAEKEFKVALQIAPNGPAAHHMYAHFLITMGRMPEGEAESRLVIEQDPMSAQPLSCVSWHGVAAADHDIIERRSAQAFKLGAPDQLARLALAWSYQLRGRHADAIPEFQKAVVGWQNAVFPTASLGHAYAVAGQAAAAREVLDGLLARAKTEYVSAYEIAAVYAGLGDRDRAFEWLDKAYDERSTMLVYFRMDPRIWSLRSDPRFQALLGRMNFPVNARQ
jgi:TolB-like protein/Tfp pilus assembly protein PilF